MSLGRYKLIFRAFKFGIDLCQRSACNHTDYRQGEHNRLEPTNANAYWTLGQLWMSGLKAVDLAHHLSLVFSIFLIWGLFHRCRAELLDLVGCFGFRIKVRLLYILTRVDLVTILLTRLIPVRGIILYDLLLGSTPVAQFASMADRGF